MSSSASSGALRQRRVKMMGAQYAAWLKKPSPHFIAVIPDESDAFTWAVLVTNLDDPFKYGEFIYTFTAGADFPQKPPENLCSHTTNGVFEKGGKICLSMGEFHAKDQGRTDTWRPSLGMPGFAENIANSMICYGDLKGGVRIVEKMSPAAMKLYARQSREHNHKNNGRLSAIFEQFIADHPDLEPVKTLMYGRAQFASHASPYAKTGDTAQGAAATPFDLTAPTLQAGARTASLSLTAMTPSPTPIQVAPSSQQAGTMPATANSIAFIGVAPGAGGAPAMSQHAMMGRNFVMPMGGPGAMGAGFPSASPPVPRMPGGNTPTPSMAPAGSSYAPSARGMAVPPPTHAHTAGTYLAPPPTPPASSGPPPTSMATAAYMHTGTRNIGISSGHSGMATAAAAVAERDGLASAPKVAFIPQQGFNLHNTTSTPSGLYSRNTAALSFQEAAAAAEAAAGTRIAGRINAYVPPPSYIPSKKVAARPSSTKEQMKARNGDVPGLAARQARQPPPSPTPPTPPTSSIAPTVPASEPSSSGPLFPTQALGAYTAPGMSAYGMSLKPVAIPPIVTPIPAPVQVVDAAARPKVTGNTATKSLAIEEKGTPPDKPTELPTLKSSASLAAAVTAVAAAVAASAADDLSDDVDRLLLGDDDAINATINAVNASFDDNGSAMPHPTEHVKPNGHIVGDGVHGDDATDDTDENGADADNAVDDTYGVYETDTGDGDDAESIDDPASKSNPTIKMPQATETNMEDLIDSLLDEQ